MSVTSNPELQKVVEQLSAALSAARTPHALIGGLAVNHYGYERSTRDIDLLVLPAATEKLRRVLGHVGKQEIPPPRKAARAIYQGVKIDLLYVDPKREAPLAKELRVSLLKSVPVVSAGGLFYLKLLSTRAKDWADLIELLKLDQSLTTTAGAFLGKINRHDLRTKLEDALTAAQRELDEPGGR